MYKVVFDIETVAFPFDRYDPDTQAYLTKYAKDEDERAEIIRKLGLSPLTARVIALAMVNPDSGQGKVFYESPREKAWRSDDGLVEFLPCAEREMLDCFWKTVVRYNQVITFNGRSFDVPFLMLRSALLGIRPTRNLLGNRYATREHCDLIDQLSFYSTCRRYSLDFYCKSFGIVSPKSDGLDGSKVEQFYSEERYREIAEYCLCDAKATAELYRKWHELLDFEV